jgi:hypothetical protein
MLLDAWGWMKLDSIFLPSRSARCEPGDIFKTNMLYARGDADTAGNTSEANEKWLNRCMGAQALLRWEPDV